jgi:uncharacterized protein
VAPPASREAHQERLKSLIEMYLTSLQNGNAHKSEFLHHLLPRVFDSLARRETGCAPAAQHPNRTCIPGLTQLFVSSQGKFYMCNNVCGPGCDIGNCDDGIDVTKVQSLLRAYVDFCEEMCQDCWAYRLCSQCFTRILEKGRISKQRKMENCEREREEISKALEQYVRIWEGEPASACDNRHTLHGMASGCRSFRGEAKLQPAIKKARVSELPKDLMIADEEIRHSLPQVAT